MNDRGNEFCICVKSFWKKCLKLHFCFLIKDHRGRCFLYIFDSKAVFFIILRIIDVEDKTKVQIKVKMKNDALEIRYCLHIYFNNHFA